MNEKDKSLELIAGTFLGFIIQGAFMLLSLLIYYLYETKIGLIVAIIVFTVGLILSILVFINIKKKGLISILPKIKK
ncbi:hypothetical protein OAQ99_01180 [Candidatus Kapabacteria bacterium]|nr:hypothetical protein [Candidatus Kapabacteria bacterium]